MNIEGVVWAELRTRPLYTGLNVFVFVLCGKTRTAWQKPAVRWFCFTPKDNFIKRNFRHQKTNNFLDSLNQPQKGFFKRHS